MRLFDDLAMRAVVDSDLVVAGIAEVAAGLVLLGVRGPATVVADDDEHGDLVAHGRVDLRPVDAVGAVAMQDDHLRVRARDLGADPERHADAHAAERTRVEPVTRREGWDRLAP